MWNAKQAQDAQKRMKDLSGSWKETGAHDEHEALLKNMRTAIVFVNTDPEVTMRRAEQRAITEGRPVQRDFVVSSNRDARASAQELRNTFPLFIDPNGPSSRILCQHTNRGALHKKNVKMKIWQNVISGTGNKIN